MGRKWLFNNVYAPSTETASESFLWYRPMDRLQLGVALLWKQGAFRGLANYEALQETAKSPNLKVGLGLQGIGTGNPGFFATSEKNWAFPSGNLNVFGGIGFRANEDHAHGLGGFKFSFPGPWTMGLQLDGHNAHPFVTYGWDRHSVGLYLIETKSLGFMWGYRW